VDLDELARLRDAATAARDQYHAAIVAANQAGHSTREIAEKIGVSHGTVANIIQRHRRGTT